MAEEDLALASRGVWVCGRVGFPELVTSFDVNE